MSSGSSIGQISATGGTTWSRVHEDPDLLARVALQLSRDFAGWVRRRVETVSYVADTTVRRHISVDFVLPNPNPSDPDDPFREIERGSWILIPLGLAEKEPFTHFDVRDESGAALSVLNTRENGNLAYRALRHLVVQSGAGPELLDVDGIPMSQVREIATSPAEAARAALRAAVDDWLGALFAEGVSERILFEDLASSFMLLVPTPYTPGRHRVIKYAYDESLGWGGSGAARSSRISLLMAALGLQDKTQSLSHPIGLAEGYHVEIVAPQEVVIADAFLGANQWSPPDADHPDGYAKVTKQVSIATQRERAHLNVTALAAGEDSEKSRGDYAFSVYSMRAQRSGTFRALLAATTLVAGLVLGARLRLAHLDDTTAAAILLVFPAVVAAYLARPGEHAFATRLLLGVRTVALVAAMCGLAVAGMLGSGLLSSHDTPLAASRIDCQAVSPAAGRDRLPTRAQPWSISCAAAPRRVAHVPPDATDVGALDWVCWISGLCAVVLWLAQAADRVRDLPSLREARRRKLSQSLAALLAVAPNQEIPGGISSANCAEGEANRVSGSPGVGCDGEAAEKTAAGEASAQHRGLGSPGRSDAGQDEKADATANHDAGTPTAEEPASDREADDRRQD